LDHRDVYEHIYEGPDPEPQKPKTTDPLAKKPNHQAAEIFKFMAKQGTQAGGESTDENPGVKYNCMPCGVLTEFPDEDTAMTGKCRKCKNPIFAEEQNEPSN